MDLTARRPYFSTMPDRSVHSNVILGCLISLLAPAVGGCEQAVAPRALPPGTRVGYYVTTNGTSSGDGTSAKPWDLQTALSGSNGRVHPGDTIWLRGGMYTGTGAINTTLTGTASAPIVVRQYPGERAILDANGGTSSTTRGDFFIVSGNYSVFWGFEVMDSDPNRTSTTRANLVIANASHLKFINLIVHDGGIGFYTYPEQTDIEIYGCLVYNNGWQQPDFGNGHGIYSKSTAGPVYLRDNIVFNQFGYGIHVYANAGSGGVNNIHVEGNVSFNNGSIDTDPVNSPNANILYGGGDPASGGSIVDNMTYFSPNVGQHNLMVGYSGTPNISLITVTGRGKASDSTSSCSFSTSVRKVSRKMRCASERSRSNSVRNVSSLHSSTVVASLARAEAARGMPQSNASSPSTVPGNA